MSKIEPRLLKGFRDYSPGEQLARQNMFSQIQFVFERFGFLPLSTPVLEYKDILMGKYGDDERLVYSFKDNGDRNVAMRYDLTVPLARFIAQNQNQLIFPFKRYQIAPVWRAENTQKGRLREFYQCDIDTVGSDSILADAEVIACLCFALESVGVENYRVRLNDRSVFAGLSVEAVRALDKLDKIGLEGVMKEMEEKNVPADQMDQVKKLIDSKDSAPVNIVTLTEQIEDFGIKGKVEFDPTIARGLDYYTGTVFEIYLNDQPEFGSVCSGGRYDNLVDQFSEQSLPAVGGSIGIDRLIDALREKGTLVKPEVITALVFNLDDKYDEQYIKLIAELRNSGIKAELYFTPEKLDKQFKYAESKNIRFAVIMGEAEIQRNRVQVKNVKNRTQEEMDVGELIEYLSKKQNS